MASSRIIHRVLVVDDELPITSLLREALQTDGHVVVVARDGGEALKAFDAGNFSLLITDYQMPVLTGGQLVQELRRRGVFIPVILISSHLPEEVRALFATDDRLSFLDKPFGLQDLRSAVEIFTRTRA